MRNKTKSLILGFIVLIACSSKTTSNKNNFFEGRITKKSEYIIKTNKVDLAFLEKELGKTAVMYFKEGNFLEKYDSGLMLEQLYNKQENKTYIKRNKSDTLYWFYCGKPGQKMLKFEINPKKEKILGIICDELVTYYDNKIITYYFNSDSLKIDSDWYKNYTAFNKNLISQKMKAIYLKYKIEYPDFIVIVTATSISRQKIDDKIFEVSKDKILIEDK